jgi:hypothetical protein
MGQSAANVFATGKATCSAARALCEVTLKWHFGNRG